MSEISRDVDAARQLERELQQAHADAADDAKRLINEKMALYEENIRLQSALTAAQALAERQSGTLADINDGLRAILNDNIEGMERERIEEIADNWKDMIARAERAQALAEHHKRDAERYQKLRNNYIFNDYGNARLTFTWQAGLDGGGSYEATMDLRRAELDAAIDAAMETG